MTPRVAIVMANANGMRFLPDCFRTLTATTPEDVPIIVVDNGSTDGSRDFLASQPRARLHLADRNLGFVHASNLGMVDAMDLGMQFVILLNNDVRLEPGWYEALLEPAKDPNVGIVGLTQTDFEGNASARTQAILANWEMEREARGEATHETPSVVDTDWVEGSCMLVRRAVIDEIGYLDPLFAPAYFEESDYCRRARLAGFHVRMRLDASIEHFGAGTSDDLEGQKRRERLLERNYLLYQSVTARTEIDLWRRLAWSIGYHASKSWSSGRMTAMDWLRVLAGLPSRMGGLRAKFHRDRKGLPCPVLGTNLPETPEQRYLAQYLHDFSPRLATGGRLA